MVVYFIIEWFHHYNAYDENIQVGFLIFAYLDLV